MKQTKTIFVFLSTCISFVFGGCNDDQSALRSQEPKQLTLTVKYGASFLKVLQLTYTEGRYFKNKGEVILRLDDKSKESLQQLGKKESPIKARLELSGVDIGVSELVGTFDSGYISVHVTPEDFIKLHDYVVEVNDPDQSKTESLFDLVPGLKEKVNQPNNRDAE